MKKRQIGTLMSMVIIAALAAGCGASQAPAVQTGEVTASGEETQKADSKPTAAEEDKLTVWCRIMASIQSAADQSGKWAITNIPKLMKSPTATNYTNQGGSSWAVMAACKNVDLAADFLGSTFGGSVKFYENILSSGAIATYLPAAESPMYWRRTGYNMVIYLSGLQNIEYSVFEAAKIDGASSFQSFWKITVPLLRPTILLTAIMSTNGTLQLFDESVNLTNGGPANATITMLHYIYNMSF